MVITRAIPPVHKEMSMSSKKTTTKTSGKTGGKTGGKATEKARREGVAQAQKRIDLIDAGLVHPSETVSGDAGVMPGAQQVASIDVNSKVELAAAAKHAARSKK